MRLEKFIKLVTSAESSLSLIVIGSSAMKCTRVETYFEARDNPFLPPCQSVIASEAGKGA